ncbi:MAG: hypothetical protein IPP72_21155 [Chitinophagaceae bacterium]|nr:hypothetical protein [Chitinophagaceae bacterium]
MRFLSLTVLLLCLLFTARAQQVGIGTQQPVAGAILDISDTARGLVIPRMGTAARLRLPNTKGMMVFDSVASGYYFNDGSGWINLPPKANNPGDMLYWNGNQWAPIAAGLGGQVLTLGTGTHTPSWKGPTTDTMFTDPRDNQQYRIKQFGSQIWMTQNLNYAPITWSWCYSYSADNCNIYGKLYDYYGALQAPPPGWHLPSDAEWDTLINYLGGPAVAGGALKSLSLWNPPNTGATNSSGFNGLPGGWYYHYGLGQGIFNSLGNEAFFYSSTLTGIYFESAWIRKLSAGSAAVERTTWPPQDGMSVRCIKD